MSHRVHPKAYRIRRVDDWSTRGYYKEPAEYLEEDFKIREFLMKKIGKLGTEKIEIERFPGKLNVIISSARPGLIIGRGGEGIERLKQELEREISKKLSFAYLYNKFEGDKKSLKEKGKENLDLTKEDENTKKQEIKIEIKEVKDFWSSATLAAQWVAQSLEKRIAYRRVLKQGLSKILVNKEIQGARVELSGRLNGAEIARREWVSDGKLPRQTIRADIDYAKTEAHCSYGVIGVKIWIYKGEKFE